MLEEQREARRRGLPKLKNPAKIWKNLRQQGHAHTAGESQQVLTQRHVVTANSPSVGQNGHICTFGFCTHYFIDLLLIFLFRGSNLL